jgi:15-cis-phytoene synthase
VGIMMTTVMNARHTHVLARAADLGVAMQLTNIARDVGEDARNGRLYLPADWLEEVGIDPQEFMANPVFSSELGTVVKRLLDEADILYSRADAGIAMLPASCRPGIRAARVIYSAIGDAIRRQGYNSVSTRAFVPTSQKLALMARTCVAAKVPPHIMSLPPLAATSFLVEAVATTSIVMKTQSVPWWNLPERFMPILTIFEKLKRHDRAMIGHETTRMG